MLPNSFLYRSRGNDCEWNEQDSHGLQNGMAEMTRVKRMEEYKPGPARICHNVETAAKIAGVEIHTIQA